MGRCNWFLLDISNGIWNTALNWCKCWWKLNDCYSHPPHFVGSATRYWWLYKYVYILVGGWPTPLKNMKVSWDYYSQHMEKKHVPNHQPVYILQKKKKLLVGSGISMWFPVDSHLKGWIPFGEGAGLSLSDIVPHAKGTCLVDQGKSWQGWLDNIYLLYVLY